MKSSFGYAFFLLLALCFTIDSESVLDITNTNTHAKRKTHEIKSNGRNPNAPTIMAMMLGPLPPLFWRVVRVRARAHIRCGV